MNNFPPGRSEFLSCFTLVEKTLGQKGARGELKKLIFKYLDPDS